ncbi:MAG TPA: NosD domain-containing protein, partial [Candidatus Lokiarchaeia archaeon]|nr:NosD domain-containing protein [Candidatus Lokiarchaeia archaeon]
LFAGFQLTLPRGANRYSLASRQPQERIETRPDSPKASGVHAPISIDGNQALINFADKAGSGTSSDPYVIQNYEIDAGGSGSCISVSNTNLFLTIRNCTVSGAGTSYPAAGICLGVNCTNVKITNCSATNCGYAGILIGANSYNNSIYGNHIFNTTFQAIYLAQTGNVNVTSNFIENATDIGIDVQGSNNTLVLRNIVSYCGVMGGSSRVGIISDRSTNCSIFGNDVKFNDYGVDLVNYDNSAASRYNIVRGNSIYNNSLGIYLGSTSQNTIRENLIVNSSGNGIYCDPTWAGNNNAFWGNLLQNNSGAQARDEVAGNTWDNGTAGNVWGDYSQKYPSASNNGYIWNTSYVVFGSPGNLDHYPLVNFDIIPPIITLLSPSNNSSHAPGFPIVLNVSDNVWVHQVLYNWDGAANLTLDDPYALAFPAQLGLHTLNIYAEDIAGNWTCQQYNFTSQAPFIMGTGLASGQLCGGAAPSFTLTVLDDCLAETWYTVDGGLHNVMCAYNSTSALDTTRWSNCPNGTVTVTFCANDTAGNTNSSTVSIQKDVIAPSIIANTPAAGQLCLVAPAFSLTIAGGGNLAAIWYSLDGGITNTTCGHAGTVAAQWGVRSSDTVMITFWVDDTLGNATSVTVTVRAAYLPITPALNPIQPNPSTTGNIELTWAAVPGADNYSVYRYTSPISTLNSSVLRMGVTTLQYYRDLGVPSGSYYYVVIAENASGTSVVSNCEAVSIQIPTSNSNPPDLPIYLQTWFWGMITAVGGISTSIIGLIIKNRKSRKSKNIAAKMDEANAALPGNDKDPDQS